MPAFMAACRAGFCPWPAVSTWPRTPSSTSLPASFARSRAALMATAPRSCAGRLTNAPLNDPTGVLAAEAITMSVMIFLLQSPDLELVRYSSGIGLFIGPSMQFHMRFGAPRDQSRKGIEGYLGRPVQREFMHLVERSVHQPREQALDPE